MHESMGREAYGDQQDGWLCETKVVSQEAVVKIADGLSYAEASTLPCAGLTAWTALGGPVPIRAGHTVLVQKGAKVEKGTPLVILEAMSAGVPVAAFSAPGPIDIIPGSNAGALAPGQTDGLKEACLACLDIDKAVVRKFAEGFSWRACAEEFYRNLQPYPEPEKTRFWRRLRRLARLRKKTAA